MTAEEMRADLKAVINYRSGENSIGSVYLGGHAMAALLRCIGGKYGDFKGPPVEELIDCATEAQLTAACASVAHTIEFMKKHPVEKCPCCGQLTNKQERVTYWLYYRSVPIYAVRLPPGAVDQDVRSAALQWHERVPLCYPDHNPTEISHMILSSEVRT